MKVKDQKLHLFVGFSFKNPAWLPIMVIGFCEPYDLRGCTNFSCRCIGFEAPKDNAHGRTVPDKRNPKRKPNPKHIEVSASVGILILEWQRQCNAILILFGLYQWFCYGCFSFSFMKHSRIAA